MSIISDELLAMVQCPETRQKLRRADEPLVAELNRSIEAGQLRNRGGDKLEKPLDAGLVREDGTVLYPVIDGIPVLLIDEGIPLKAG
jgi:uncharacterized protein YbaR (Trm112 family)